MSRLTHIYDSVLPVVTCYCITLTLGPGANPHFLKCYFAVWTLPSKQRAVITIKEGQGQQCNTKKILEITNNSLIMQLKETEFALIVHLTIYQNRIRLSLQFGLLQGKTNNYEITIVLGKHRRPALINRLDKCQKPRVKSNNQSSKHNITEKCYVYINCLLAVL